jgi:hypothetical protein
VSRLLPCRENLDTSGRLLPELQLREKLARAGVASAEKLMAYCGSGVTACHILLVIEQLGVGKADCSSAAGPNTDTPPTGVSKLPSPASCVAAGPPWNPDLTLSVTSSGDACSSSLSLGLNHPATP